jgi:hypothetical protein
VVWGRREILGAGFLAVVGGMIVTARLLLPPSRRLETAVPRPYDESQGFPIPEQTAELFRDGSRHQLADGALVTVMTTPGGALRLPTGRLVAVDPSWRLTRIQPYTVAVPPGSYPVTLAVVSPPDGGLVAAVKVTLKDRPVARWELALRPGEDPALLAPGEAYNVGVDAATMALLDAAALPAIARRFEADDSLYVVRERSRAIEVTEPESGGNLIAFSTGYGDGGYPVWFGRTAAGEIAHIIVDMALLRRRDGATASPGV